MLCKRPSNPEILWLIRTRKVLAVVLYQPFRVVGASHFCLERPLDAQASSKVKTAQDRKSYPTSCQLHSVFPFPLNECLLGAALGRV